MPAYYYVKVGGTATGDGGRTITKRTGTWNASTADYYDNIDNVWATVTTDPVAGDYILVSSAHYKSQSLTSYFLRVEDGCRVVSVDDANQDTYKAGAHEENTNAVGNMYLNWLGKTVGYYGVKFTYYNHLVPGGSTANAFTYLKDCHLKTYNTSTTNSITGRSGTLVTAFFDDCLIEFTIGQFIEAGLGTCNFFFRGGSITGPRHLFTGSTFLSGSGKVTLDSVDLSGLSGSTYNEIMEYGGSGNNVGDILIHRCEFPTDISLIEGTVTNRDGMGQVIVTSCADPNGVGAEDFDSWWLYHYSNRFGTIDLVKDIYRGSGETTYDGVDDFSYELDTYAACSRDGNFFFKLPPIPDQDHTSSITYTLHFDSPTSGLLDTDVAFSLARSHVGASAALSHWATGVIQSTQETNPMVESGSALSAGSGWTGGTNSYKISITVTGDALHNTQSQIEPYIHVFKPSITLNVDPRIEIT